MKLIITIVSNDDSSSVQKALINERFFNREKGIQ